MSVINSVIEQAEKSCQEQGKQLTPKRKTVLRALVESNIALSAYELIEYCKTRLDLTLQPMSVYRILDFLVEAHLVHKLKVSNKYIVCSHIRCEHDHGIPQFLICTKCDKITEQDLAPEMVIGLKSHARQQGFTVTTQQLEINGICDDCSE
ncbi:MULTISPECIES: Fur family transcriptional regulator [unclassified Vibrio]|uniref:Fur family transcriptional regulator n=1 Tax=Vibrio sp. HB236076 TaxID=3232307 RepID=A0AB39HB50_9VIBR|nr:Fur family transcriptional regulator [Vibrio sp. HB161653]MDP5255281.1 Fur family transcriptional regulator [Vibrio sp. HB161653]